MNGQSRIRAPIRLDATRREQLESQFLRDFYEIAIRIDPDNLECLVELGDLYHHYALYEKSEIVDTRLTELCPDEPIFHYNLACSFSRLKECGRALDALRRALALGYDDYQSIEADEDLLALRSMPEFRELILEHFRRP